VDQLYFEDGYYEGKYFVYTASASAGFAPYIAEGYLDQDFFEDRGSRSSLVCDGIRLRIVTAEASLASAFAQTTTGNTDARTTVTLSTIANVSAQALKLRQLSSSLSAVATHTVQSSITARANLAITSAFAPTITAQASVSNGSNFTTNFALTALTGVRRQFPLNQLDGLGATSSQAGRIEFNQSLFPPPVSGNTFTVRSNDWTFSSWVKRDSITGAFECIAEGTVQGDAGGSPINNGGIALKNSNVRIRTNYDPDEPGGEWVGVAPTDTEWHHYLFRSHIPEAGLVRRWNLWIDGVYQGLSSGNFSAGDLQFAGRYGSGQGTLYGGLRLGNGSIAQETGSYEITAAPLQGGIAQVWMGTTTDAQFRVERFYSGLLDLGANGTSTGLPTPVFYNKLTTPFDGVTWNTGATPVPSPASTPLGLPSVQARFSLVGESVTVLEVTVNAQSQATLTGTIFRNRVAAASLTSTATVTAEVAKIAGFDSQLTTTASTTLISQRVRYADSALASALTLTSTAFRVKQFDLAVNSLATVSATTFRIKPLSAAMVSQFTLTGTIDNRNRDAVSLEVGAFTLTGLISRTRRLSSSITATCTFNIVYEVIRPAGSAMSASFTQIANAEKRIISFGVFVVTATAVITGFRVAIAQANLQVNGFTLTQGDILNFDPCREIAVDQETRLARILPENRLIIVESETRALRVPQETRVLRVDFETRVNITQC
jgi:hypothetical protein